MPRGVGEIRVVDRGDQGRNEAGLSRRQAPRRLVEYIAEVIDRLQDPFPGHLRNLAVLLQRTRHGHRGNAGRERNVSHGRRLAIQLGSRQRPDARERIGPGRQPCGIL
jgi:hypothetical protein